MSARHAEQGLGAAADEPSPLAGWHRFWFTPGSLVRLGAWRALVCGLALYDVLLHRGICASDAARVEAGNAVRSWNPIYLFDLLGIEPFSSAAVEVLLWVSVTALACGALGLFSRLSCAVGAAAFFVQAGLVYSFGKPHHDKVALAFAIAVLPLAPVGARMSLDAIRRAARGLPVPETSEWARWPIRVAQVAVATGYGLAGLSKLWMAGPDWFNGYSLQGILIGHDNDFARLVAGSLFASQVQAVGLVATQALFPLVLFVPRTRWVLVPLAVSFHLVTWATMDTGPYMRLWLLNAAFLPLERVPATLRTWIRERGGFARAAGLVFALGVPALVVCVVSLFLPWWIVVVGLGPPLVAGAVYLTDRGRGVYRFDASDPRQQRAVARLRGFDWSKRLRFEEVGGSEVEEALPSFDPGNGNAVRGPAAVRAAARRTVAAPFARWLSAGLPG